MVDVCRNLQPYSSHKYARVLGFVLFTCKQANCVCFWRVAVSNTCNACSFMQLRNSILVIERGQKSNDSSINHSGYVLKSPDYGNPKLSCDGTDGRIAMFRSNSGDDIESHTINGLQEPKRTCRFALILAMHGLGLIPHEQHTFGLF
jgi:hypothetical protein